MRYLIKSGWIKDGEQVKGETLELSEDWVNHCQEKNIKLELINDIQDTTRGRSRTKAKEHSDSEI